MSDMLNGPPGVRVLMERWVIDRLRGKGLPRPIVDLGGKAHRGQMIEWLGHDRFETWDARAGRDVTRVIDAEEMLTIPDNQVGAYICLATFEHVERPWVAAREIARTLRGGCNVYLVAPFIYEFHEAPRDFWRFTPDALEFLFKGLLVKLDGGWLHCPSGRAMSFYIGGKP